MNRERGLVWAAGALCVLAVGLIGGAHPWTQVGLAAVAIAITGAFVLVRGSRGVRIVPFAWPLLLVVGFAALQLVPLPAAIVRVLSPGVLQARSDAAGTDPAWLPLTYDVPATVLALVRAAALAGLLVTIGTLVRPLQRAHRQLLVLALLGAGLAVVAFAHRAVDAKAMFGLYTPRGILGRSFCGTLVNGNHAASVFMLSGLISLGLAVELKGGRRQLCIVAALLCGAGLLLTASRMGAVAAAVGAVLFGLAHLTRSLGRGRGIGVTVLLIAVGSGAALWSADELRARFDGDVEALVWNPKTRGFRDGAVLAAHHPLVGVGRGAFEAPVLAVRAQDDGVRLVYPEDIVVQHVAELGIPMTLLLAGLALLAARRVWRVRSSLEPGTLGAACGVLAVLLHELADFGTELPGVAFPTVVALGVVVARAGELGHETEPRLARVTPAVAGLALAGWAVALVAAAWAAPRTLTADQDRVATLARAHDPGLQDALRTATLRHPADDYFPLVAAEDALRRRDPRAPLELNRALALHPAGWQAHRLAARMLAASGKRSQAALEYRLAAEHGWTAPFDELLKVTGDVMYQAVKQEPGPLLEAARQLAHSGRAAAADHACLRALELGGDERTVQLERLALAAGNKDARVVHQAAAALLDRDRDAETYARVAQALDTVGDPVGADRALAAGRARHKSDGSLLVETARLKLRRNDLEGARATLRSQTDAVLTLAQRKAMEELLAEIADKSGDVDGAIAARARAHLLQARIQRGQ